MALEARGAGKKGVTFLNTAVWSKEDRKFLYLQLQLPAPEDQAIVHAAAEPPYGQRGVLPPP